MSKLIPKELLANIPKLYETEDDKDPICHIKLFYASFTWYITEISIDEDTAEFYSTILRGLKKRGTPIPTNDIWIAAAAFQHGLQLYSLDQHFQSIEGLLLR